MIHSEPESEPDFSFAIKLVSDFDSVSKSDSECNSSSALKNLNICIFLLYICILLNKPVDNSFYPLS